MKLKDIPTHRTKNLVCEEHVSYGDDCHLSSTEWDLNLVWALQVPEELRSAMTMTNINTLQISRIGMTSVVIGI